MRSLCVQWLGLWIEMYHEKFLEDKYLKYIGWLLNDKDAGVRKAAVEVVILAA